MPHKHNPPTEVEPLDLTYLAPEVGVGELLNHLPLLMEILDALKTGTGSFSTASPWGMRYVTVSADKPA